MVHGKPRHPQSQGSVERLNCDVKDMLTAWLGDNDSTDWPMGLRFVQFQKNSSYHSGIKQSPYKALFGSEAKVGLRSNTLPTEILERMVSEEDLLAAYSVPSSEREATGHVEHQDVSEATGTMQPDTADPEDSELRVNQQNIEVQRKRAVDGQLSQAERMVKRSRLEHVAGNPGDNVTIPIPLVDRGKGDPRNIMGVIVDRNENDLYRVAVKAGILKGHYSRTQFDLCTNKLFNIEDMSRDVEVGLRQAVQSESRCGGQGYAKCNCAASGKQCQTNRCKCFKSGVKCNSRCHSSTTCPNKN
ncbi:hypothetical protein SNE40_001219 [Patella caerulea]|uniref:Integrase catalytic domain-containing protein n=1 Tax=Patella caerulea TaxID=87958 RepID=A0AAN8Q7W8_PATCE